MIDRIHHLVDRAARDTPEALAVRDCDGHEVTYRAHAAAVDAAAGVLADAGLRAGDRLVLVAENCHATSVLIFAASKLGAVSIPVNARMTAGEIARITDHATPRLIAYSTGISPDAAGHAGAIGAREVQTDCGTFALSPLQPATGAPTTPETAVMLYTTGTTGAPKGVMLTHGNLIFGGRTSAQLRQMQPRDLIYGVLPVTHVFGLASMLMAATSRGAAIQFEARFRPDRLYAALVGGVTVFPGVPQMHALLMAHVAKLGLTHLSDVPLHYVSSGGAPLDPAWKRKAEEFYGLPLQNGYGMTETTAGITATSNPVGTRDVSVGPPLPGVEVRLDIDVPAAIDDGVGEILTRGPHVMDGYYANLKATREVLTPDGWMRTGDLGRFDADGFLHIVGRAKELIIRGGFNVYPPEVEAAFNDHADVVQCSVIGRTRDGNEEVLAFVQCADPDTLDLDALRAFAAERLAAYKRPSLIIPARTLPAAPSGKILKHMLAEVFADQLATFD